MQFSFLRSILPRRGREFPPLAPEVSFYAIGDIHGCDDLLAKALHGLPEDGPIVCVGDYVDRGPQSAQVLHRLMGQPDIICLRGNHEEMLLDFLEHPQDQGRAWLRHGGLETLASFGVPGPPKGADGQMLEATAQALRQAMGDRMITWLHQRPFMYHSGNVVVVHAGMDPTCPVGEQLRDDLIWGHAGFLSSSRTDGTWVVHGHTIVKAPTVRAGRIAIDTGAFATGRLTVARIETGAVTFLEGR